MSIPESSIRPALTRTLDVVDCYNEDLEWILNKLVARAGGSIGWILRFFDTDAQPTILAEFATGKDCDAVDAGRVGRAVFAHERGSRALNPEHLREVEIPDPQSVGSLQALYMVFTPAQGVTIAAAVCRPKASFRLIEDMVVRRLQPVLERYIKLWWMHRTERRRADAFQGAIDLADLGAVVLDRRAVPVFVNVYARSLCVDAESTSWMSGAALTRRSGEAARLQNAIQNALLLNSIADLGSRARKGIMLTLKREPGERPLILTVLPVRQPAVDPIDPAALVIILDPSRDVRDLLGPASSLYRLTAAERRLVEHIVSGDSIADAAKSLRISVQTARGYLRHVFDKTQTSRQAELVSVMFASALRATVGFDMTVL